MMNFWYKSALAAVSGVACWIVFSFDVGSDDSERTILQTVFAWSPGFLFAGGVLFPYLSRDRWVVYRATALVLVSSLSYWAALRVAVGFNSGFFPNVPGVEDFIGASVAGAAIVLSGARLIIPLRHSYRLVITGIVAAVIGGLVFAAPPLWGTKEDSFILAYAAWHVLLAGAIHFGEKTPWRSRPVDPPE